MGTADGPTPPAERGPDVARSDGRSLPQAVLRLPSLRIALSAAAVLGGVMALSPLLGLHGVESAVVLGLVLPPFAGAVGAALVGIARSSDRSVAASALLRGATAAAIGIWLVPTLLLAFNALHFRQCTPVLGLSFVVLGPGIGCVLAALVGVLVGGLVPRARLARLLAVAAPFAAVVLGLYRLYDTPGVVSYSPFVGYAPGTLYDESLRLPAPYVTFRLTTSAWMLGVWALFVAGWEARRARVTTARLKARWPTALLASVLLAIGLTTDAYGPELGHRSSVEGIRQELGATFGGERCDIVVPRELPRVDARRLLRDCDFRVAQVERRLGLTQPRRITAFFFRDADEKQRLMGAGRTYIAKPWRDEVYLQLSGWPHPVLAHELTHVIAGNAAGGPLRISGRLGGVLPEPGLIEGIAVATAWDVRDDLTPHEWSAAMLQLDELPSLEEVLGLSFGALPARRAYGAAGSFVRFVDETYGAQAVRAAYRDAGFEAATGHSLAELEHAWHERLRQVPLTDAALERARVLLTRRSIFSAVCPHQMANLREQLSGDLAAGDDRRLRTTCQDLLQIDPADASARAALVGVLARTGDRSGADDELSRLAEAPAAFQDAAREAMADALWRAADAEQALGIYRELLSSSRGEDAARLLEVKSLALAAGGRQSRLVRDLLVGRDTTGTAPAVAVHLAAEIAREREDGLGAYLHGRQLFNAQRHDLAIPLLRRASRLGLPTPRLARECRRIEAVSLYARGRFDEAATLFRQLARDESGPEAGRVEARDWLERIRWARLARETPRR